MSGSKIYLHISQCQLWYEGPLYLVMRKEEEKGKNRWYVPPLKSEVPHGSYKLEEKNHLGIRIENASRRFEPNAKNFHPWNPNPHILQKTHKKDEKINQENILTIHQVSF